MLTKLLRVNFFFLFLFFVFPLFSEKNERREYSSYVSIGAGLRTALGSASEFVFSNELPVSTLNWQILPSFGFQFNIDTYLIRRFHFSLVMHAGLPASSGRMTDSDYINSDPKARTHFSVHNLKLKKDFSFLYTAGIFCPPYTVNAAKGSRFVLLFEPLTGIRVSFKEWYADGGYDQYPQETHPPVSVWTESRPKKPYKGKGVNYIQHIYSPFIGLNIFTETEQNIDFSFGFTLSPAAVGKCTDLHLDDSKRMKYEDIFETGGLSFSLNHSFIKRFNSYSGVLFNASFLFFSNYEGYANISKIDGSVAEKTEKGTSGTNLAEFTTMLGVIFYLGRK